MGEGDRLKWLRKWAAYAPELSVGATPETMEDEQRDLRVKLRGNIVRVENSRSPLVLHGLG